MENCISAGLVSGLLKSTLATWDEEEICFRKKLFHAPCIQVYYVGARLKVGFGRW